MKKNEIDNVEFKDVATKAALAIANDITDRPDKWSGGSNEDGTLSIYHPRIALVVYDKKDKTFTIHSCGNDEYPIYTKDKTNEAVIALDRAFVYHDEYNRKQSALSIIKKLGIK